MVVFLQARYRPWLDSYQLTEMIRNVAAICGAQIYRARIQIQYGTKTHIPLTEVNVIAIC